MNIQDVRRFIFSLPDVTEAPHHEKSSFRVRGKIFATIPTGEEHLHVLVDQAIARAVVDTNRDGLEELWWGKRIVGVRVRLAEADEDIVRTLLEEAYHVR